MYNADKNGNTKGQIQEVSDGNKNSIGNLTRGHALTENLPK